MNVALSTCVRVVGVVAACEEALLTEERHHLILVLHHLSLGDKESSAAMGSWLTDRDAIAGKLAQGRWRLVLLHPALWHVVWGTRCDEDDNVERIGHEEEEYEDDKCEVVPLRSQRDGDGGRVGGISNWGV
jgi:hypothetical protein